MQKETIFAITGTSRGIGKAIAEFYLAKGFTVTGCSRSPTSISHSNYTHSEVDVTDEVQVQKWVRKLKNDLKRIDVLVCNVGLVKSALYMTMTSGQLFESFLKTNLAATFYVCREVSKIMLTANYGRIITISSILTELHVPGTSAYSMTKSGIIELTKVLASELAPNITCNTVSPSVVETESIVDMGEDWKNKMLNLQTIKRFITADEICNVISFFSSQNSGAITGQVVNMCLVN